MTARSSRGRTRIVRARARGRALRRWREVLVAALVVVGGPTAATAQADWSPASGLTANRFEHTATLLPNGRVLVAGGQIGPDVTSSAQLYDPATNTWSTAASMQVARVLHSATLLPSGKVLVAGGAAGGVTTSAELYDPATNTWSPADDLGTARYWHTATLLPDGRVLVAGGQDFSATFLTAELYDPQTDTWSPAASMATQRRSHTATLLAAGKVLVAGGNTGVVGTAAAELYDPLADDWTPAATMGATRYWHTATALPDGSVLVAGGGVGPVTLGITTSLASTERYLPATDTWSPAPAMIGARFAHTATLMGDGHVLVAAGRLDDDAIATAERYDVAGGMWSSVASMAQARHGHSATLVPGDKVLVAGGFAIGASTGAELFAATSPPAPPLPPPPPPPPPPPARCDDCDADTYPANDDCNDANPAIHRGAADTPGNGVDEDCSGSDAGYPRLGSSIAIAVRHAGRRTVFTRLAVIPAFAGSAVRLTCSGRGCPFATASRRVGRSRDKLDLLPLLRRARLRPGTRLEIRLTKPGTLGVVRMLTMRAGRPPLRRNRCLVPGASRPSICPR